MSQKIFLVSIERNWARWVLRVEPHALEGNIINDWGDKNVAAVFKADETTVEKMVGGVYSFSKPWLVNFSVRLFSVTVRTSWSEAPCGRVASISMVTVTSAPG